MTRPELAAAALLLAGPGYALDAAVRDASGTAVAADAAVLRQKGYGPEDALAAASLASLWGLDLASVAAAHHAGYGWSELGEAGKLAAMSGFSLGTVLAMRETGLSWAGVAEAVNVAGVDMRDAPRDPAPVRRAAAPRKAGQPSPRKAEVIKGKGPKMDPGRLRSVW